MKKNNIYENFLGLLLIGLFVLTSFMVILLGANDYSKMVKNNTDEQKYRVAFDYIRNRIEEANSIEDIIIDDKQIIIMNDDYSIVIYHDEYIKEMLVKDVSLVDEFDGEKIIKVNDIAFNKVDNQIMVEIDGRRMEMVKR